MNAGPSFFLLIAKSVLIALVAAITSTLLVLMAGLALSRSDGLPLESWQSLFAFALLGNFAIGLPVALLVYFLSGRQLVRFPSIIGIIALLAGIMSMLASFVIAEREGVLFLGIPSLISAAVFAGLGWLWIIRPLRSQLTNIDQERNAS